MVQSTTQKWPDAPTLRPVIAESRTRNAVAAVVAGDPQAARAAMDAHMDEAADTLRQAVVNDPG
jgi:DNA-binding GntR family transcriptional regulator